MLCAATSSECCAALIPLPSCCGGVSPATTSRLHRLQPGTSDAPCRRLLAPPHCCDPCAAAVMSRLHHPNVCHLLAITRQPACLVMEYASRRSVDKLLSGGLKDAKVGIGDAMVRVSVAASAPARDASDSRVGCE